MAQQLRFRIAGDINLDVAADQTRDIAHLHFWSVRIDFLHGKEQRRNLESRRGAIDGERSGIGFLRFAGPCNRSLRLEEHCHGKNTTHHFAANQFHRFLSSSWPLPPHLVGHPSRRQLYFFPEEYRPERSFRASDLRTAGFPDCLAPIV